MKRKVFAITVMIVFLFAGFSNLFAAGEKEAAEPEVIKIGASVSMTGNLARFGNMVKSGYELWQKEVNANGGIKVGDKMLPVEIIYYDDQSDNQTSLSW